MRQQVILGLVVILLAGCAETVWVTKGEDERLPGLPFHVKKEVLNQTTVYAQTWMQVTLSVKKFVRKKNGSDEFEPLEPQTFVKQIKKEELKELDELRKYVLLSGANCGFEQDSRVTKFAVRSGHVDTNTIKSVRISNTVQREWIVNSTDIYYLNAPLPWFGSNKLAYELNGDGTLAKAESNPDTKLADGLSSLIPFKEYLAGKFVTSSTAVEASGVAAQQLQAAEALLGIKKNDGFELRCDLSLDIAETGYLYTFYKQHETASAMTSPIPFDLKGNALFSREEIGSQAGKSEEAANIELSGKISIPKDIAAPKGTK